MRVAKALAFGVLLSVAAAAPAFADVQVTLQNGYVSIVAKDATVRQILTEWARVGQTKIVNVERIPGGPVTLQLINVTEKQALEVLLRSVSGYLAAARPVAAANLSRFDRIVVMPTAAAPRAATPSAAAPVFQPQQAPPPPPDDDRDDERPAPNVAVPPPVFNPFPQPQMINPPPQAMPTAVPGVTGTPPIGPGEGGVATPSTMPPTSVPSATPASPFGGTPRPGMIVPAPQQPGQPGAPPPGQPNPGD